jgi:hypothetical protein
VERYNNPKPKELLSPVCTYSREEGFFLACGDWSTLLLVSSSFMRLAYMSVYRYTHIQTQREEWLAGRFGIREKEGEEEEI